VKKNLKLIYLAIFIINLIIIPQYNYSTYNPPEILNSKEILGAWAVDFSQYYSAALALKNGENFYDTDLIYKIGKDKGAFNSQMDYLYPPFFLFFIIPFTFLPFKLASILWLSLNQIFIVALIFISLAIFKAKSKDLLCFSFGLIGIFYPVFYELRLGQADLIVGILLYLSLYLILRKKIILGSILYSLSCCLKLSPIILIAYFFRKKFFKILALSLAATLIIIIGSNSLIKKDIVNNYFLKILPGLATSSKFMDLNRQDSDKNYLQLNQSLGSLVEKAFLLKTGLRDYSRSLSAVKIYSFFLRLAAFLPVLILLKSNKTRYNLLAWEVSIIIVVMLLVNSGSFLYHFSILILPICGVLKFLSDNYKRIPINYYALFIISFILLGFRLGYNLVPLDNLLLFWGSSKLFGLIIFLCLLIKIYRYNLQHNLHYEK